MNFYYYFEKKKFDKSWEILRQKYTAAGMSESAIQELHDFDWHWFCLRRSYISHMSELPIDSSTVQMYKDEGLPLEDSLPGRFDWVETIENRILHQKLKKLSPNNLELLTLFAIDGFSQPQIARLLGYSQSKISRKMSKIKEFLL